MGNSIKNKTVNKPRPILGKISRLNALPINFPLENNIIKHKFKTIHPATPAVLNKLIHEDKLDISAVSSIEYAKNYKNYYLIPNLAIASQGPIQSVLLFSTCPFSELNGETILISSETNTSSALLKIFCRKLFKIKTKYQIIDSADSLNLMQLPKAYLSIGDEAIKLTANKNFPFCLDLGKIWHDWTNKPFIFALWVITKKAYKQNIFCDFLNNNPYICLQQARDWSLKNLEKLSEVAYQSNLGSKAYFNKYFLNIRYRLGEKELNGLNNFYELLKEINEIPEIPKIEYYPV